MNKSEREKKEPLKKKKYLGKEKVFVDFEDGDEAITNVKVISSLDFFSFLALSPVTGRTHQLRVHLSDIGHPIVGDNKYDENKNKSSNHFRNPTLQLHCFQLIFSLLSGKVETVQAEIRNDMKNNINAVYGAIQQIDKLIVLARGGKEDKKPMPPEKEKALNIATS